MANYIKMVLISEAEYLNLRNFKYQPHELEQYRDEEADDNDEEADDNDDDDDDDDDEQHRQQQENELRRQEEENARIIQAEENARMQAEENARMRAEEDARIQAEENARIQNEVNTRGQEADVNWRQRLEFYKTKNQEQRREAMREALRVRLIADEDALRRRQAEEEAVEFERLRELQLAEDVAEHERRQQDEYERNMQLQQEEYERNERLAEELEAQGRSEEDRLRQEKLGQQRDELEIIAGEKNPNKLERRWEKFVVKTIAKKKIPERIKEDPPNEKERKAMRRINKAKIDVKNDQWALKRIMQKSKIKIRNDKEFTRYRRRFSHLLKNIRRDTEFRNQMEKWAVKKANGGLLPEAVEKLLTYHEQKQLKQKQKNMSPEVIINLQRITEDEILKQYEKRGFDVNRVDEDLELENFEPTEEELELERQALAQQRRERERQALAEDPYLQEEEEDDDTLMYEGGIAKRKEEATVDSQDEFLDHGIVLFGVPQSLKYNCRQLLRQLELRNAIHQRNILPPDEAPNEPIAKNVDVPKLLHLCVRNTHAPKTNLGATPETLAGYKIIKMHATVDPTLTAYFGESLRRDMRKEVQIKLLPSKLILKKRLRAPPKKKKAAVTILDLSDSEDFQPPKTKKVKKKERKSRGKDPKNIWDDAAKAKMAKWKEESEARAADRLRRLQMQNPPTFRQAHRHQVDNERARFGGPPPPAGHPFASYHNKS